MAKRNDVKDMVSIKTEPGDNAKYLAHSLTVFSMPDIDTTDPQAVSLRTIDYFALCQQNDMKPSVEGYALSLGVDRVTLLDWASGRVRRPTSVVSTVKKAVSLLNSQMADYMQNGKINPVSGIFLMKNNHGYRDQQEIAIQAQQGISQEVAEKYDMLPEEIG